MGANTYGQLGDGTTTVRITPVKVIGLTGVVAISAGGFHTVALKGDGTVWAWGRSTLVPTQVSGLTGVVSISDGLFHTVAVKGDGTDEVARMTQSDLDNE